MEAWIPLLVALIGAIVTLIGAGKKVWTKAKVIEASVKAVEAFKVTMAASGQPETGRLLTNGIADAISGAGVKKAHEAALKSAGVNLDAILGPAIAAAARDTE